MGSKTRIIILRMRTLIYTLILSIILILIVVFSALMSGKETPATPTYSIDSGNISQTVK